MDKIKEYRMCINEAKRTVAVYQQGKKEPLITGDDNIIYQILIRELADKIARNDKHKVSVFVHGNPGVKENGIIYSTEE